MSCLSRPDPGATESILRIAFKEFSQCENSWLNCVNNSYDHLQSSSIILEEDGDLYSKTLYTAFGEERDTDTTGLSDSPTDYKYTGQRSYLDDFGLHYYVARWYDPQTAHFAQADTIIPEPDFSYAWDRYAYVVFNPIRFSDSTGHWIDPEDPGTPPDVRSDQMAKEAEYVEATVTNVVTIYFGGMDTSLDEPGVPVVESFDSMWFNEGLLSIDNLVTVTYNGTSKESTAQLAYKLIQDKFPNTSGLTFNVVGYSAGADAAIMFTKLYGDELSISSLVAIGPTYSGGFSGLGRTNISHYSDWLDDAVNTGTDVMIINDSSTSQSWSYSGSSDSGNTSVWQSNCLHTENHRGLFGEGSQFHNADLVMENKNVFNTAITWAKLSLIR